MYTVLIVFVIFILCIIIYAIAVKSYDYNFLIAASATIGIFAAIVLIIMGICIASKDNSATVSIAKFEAIRTTIQEQRANTGSELERVEMTKTIIENNTWLADQKASYYNPWGNWFCSDLYLKVQPLK